MSRAVEHLFAALFEAAGVGRHWGEAITASQGQTQARWQTMWIAAAGPWTVPQIARRLGVSRQNVQRIANELLAEGLATFEDNPDHKSSPLFVLSSTGQDTLERINTAADRDHQRLLRGFPEADVRALNDLLRRLTDQLKTLGA